MVEEGNILDELIFLKKEVRRLRKSLNLLTPGIEILLKRRGFHIFKKELTADLLLPKKEAVHDYYRMLHKYSFRLFLRDVIKNQFCFNLEEVKKYASLDVTKKYINFLITAGLADKKPNGYRLTKTPIRSFGVTLEWYVAEVLKKEFHYQAIWGVRLKGPKVSGDFDVLAKFNGSIFYVEVKSSPPKQIYDNEISAFLDRFSALSPEISVFFIDTELRMKDKIVPMFENAFIKRFATSPNIIRMERELFHINNKIFIINAKSGIVHNMEKVFNWYFHNRSSSL